MVSRKNDKFNKKTETFQTQLNQYDKIKNRMMIIMHQVVQSHGGNELIKNQVYLLWGCYGITKLLKKVR
jgi:hypothetical protein